MGLGAVELIFLFLVILLLFGAKRLPEIGSSSAKGSASSRLRSARSNETSRFLLIANFIRR